MYETLVSKDIVDSVEGLASNETYVAADLADLAGMMQLLKDADMVVHFGAIGDEAPWKQILQQISWGPTTCARLRIKTVCAVLSIHAVGMHPKSECIGTDVPHRPDTFYGLAKCFGEDPGSLYWDKRGIEAVCMRIYSCAEAANPRAVGSWLSYDDLIQLVTRAIDTPVTGFAVLYGISDNKRAPVDNSKARFLGCRPKDNAE